MTMPNISYTLSAAGSSPVYACDNFIAPFNIGYGTTVSGTPTYAIQFTFDDVQADGYNPATGTWFVVSGTAGTAAVSGSFTIPCRGLRLVFVSGSGSVTGYFQQAGAR